MQRPVNYNTKQGEAILAYLISVKGIFVTAAQIAEQLNNDNVAISRPTVYRQLEKLIKDGRVQKYSFDGAYFSHFQYVDSDEMSKDLYHLKCEICDGVYELQCDEVDSISRHIYENHAFQVNDRKIVFYGKCELCLQK